MLILNCRDSINTDKLKAPSVTKIIITSVFCQDTSHIPLPISSHCDLTHSLTRTHDKYFSKWRKKAIKVEQASSSMLTFKGISLHVQRKNNEDASKGTLYTEVLNAISHPYERSEPE